MNKITKKLEKFMEDHIDSWTIWFTFFGIIFILIVIILIGIEFIHSIFGIK